MSTIEDGGQALSNLTLRDYFAAKALNQVLASSDEQDALGWSEWTRKCAAASYEIADAMLDERAK